MIFYFEYPLKTWGNPFFATYFLQCTSSSRSYFTSEQSTNCLPVHLSNHQIWFFESKSRYSIDLFFKNKMWFLKFSLLLAIKHGPFFTKSTKQTNLAFWIVEGVSFFLSVLYFIFTMDGLSKCPPSHPPPEKKDLLVYFTHWRL